MKKQFTQGKTIKLTAAMYVLAVAAILIIANACNKSRQNITTVQADDEARQVTPAVQGQPLTAVVNVAMMRTTADGSITRAMFNENAEVFSIQNSTVIAALKEAFARKQPVQITFDPWKATVLSVSNAPVQAVAVQSAKQIVNSPGTAHKINLASMSDDVVNGLPVPAGISPISSTTSSLTNVIPNFETAQMMFNYIAHQCCALPGPYGVDHCISFQYCEDGCYARAHKMCYIINNKYHYGTQKIFSFANAGSDELCVQGQKWGGCCVNWWYHVAPLVTIQTPTGPKAYVFDPAMFDQPVLLSAWLHAQENPACVPGGDVPHVSMINVQPTSSYSPAGSSGYSFDTDPLYSNTNSTLTSYRHLSTCP